MEKELDGFVGSSIQIIFAIPTSLILEEHNAHRVFEPNNIIVIAYFAFGICMEYMW
jgi:hypothetical protein